MSNKSQKPIVIRFVLDLQAEDASFVDLEFSNIKQARKAIESVAIANGALVSLQTKAEIPVLLRTGNVSAAFPIDYDEDEETAAEDDE